MNSLNAKAWFGLVFLAVVTGLLLFIPAATVKYWQAWCYLGVFFGASLLITLYLTRKDPALLKHRLSSGPMAEKQKTQKLIMLLLSIGFVASLVVPALDHRFAWSNVPPHVVIAGEVLTALWFYIVFLVYKANPYASGKIEIVEGQRVISTGPYAFVRHPMYSGGLLLFIGTPLALGSYWGLLPSAATLSALIWRLIDEEKFLLKNLPGYGDYCARVRWRLIPGVF